MVVVADPDVNKNEKKKKKKKKKKLNLRALAAEKTSKERRASVSSDELIIVEKPSLEESGIETLGKPFYKP